MDQVEQSIFKNFGYKQIDFRDKWTVYQNCLIVINPEFKPKVYRLDCCGSYYELEPQLD